MGVKGKKLYVFVLCVYVMGKLHLDIKYVFTVCASSTVVIPPV